MSNEKFKEKIMTSYKRRGKQKKHKNVSFIIVIILNILMVSLLLSCSFIKEKDKEQPNILLIVSEDHGQELSCYGDKNIITPNIDKFAQEGIRFTNAYVTQAVCSPSRSSILTGLYPHQNGHLGVATLGYRFVGKVDNLYSMIKSAGYRTGMIGKLHLNPVSDFSYDFRRIEESNFAKEDLSRYSAYAKAFMQTSESPFFLMVNFPDAHLPFQRQVEGKPRNPIGPDDINAMPYIGFNNKQIRKRLANYYNCLLRLDESVGELLNSLDHIDKTENTVVMFLSDHGAQVARGKLNVYEAGTKVPFIIRWPDKIEDGIVSEQLISTIDIVPTILDIAGQEIPSDLPGKSLIPLFSDNLDNAFRNYLFTEKNAPSPRGYFPQRTIRNDRYKLIYSLLNDRKNPEAEGYLEQEYEDGRYSGAPSYEELKSAPAKIRNAYKTWLESPKIQLYDLKNDPWEFVNLASSHKHEEIKQKLFKELIKWMKETNDPLLNEKKLKMLTTEHDTFKSFSQSSDWHYPYYLYNEKKDNKPK